MILDVSLCSIQTTCSSQYGVVSAPRPFYNSIESHIYFLLLAVSIFERLGTTQPGIDSWSCEIRESESDEREWARTRDEELVKKDLWTARYFDIGARYSKIRPYRTHTHIPWYQCPPPSNHAPPPSRSHRQACDIKTKKAIGSRSAPPLSNAVSGKIYQVMIAIRSGRCPV